MRTIESFVAGPARQGQNPRSLAAIELQTTLVGMMGHDLRSSLHVIQGTYALLRSRLHDVPQQAWIDRGERAVTKLTEQLNCLVDAFYLAERTNALEITALNLGPLFWRLRHENEDAALQRGIDVRSISTSACVTSNPILLALLWQIVDFSRFIGFPNQFFNDSWVVGSWRADQCRDGKTNSNAG